jgi:dTDP-4-dehydrorhamnose 3,5-epimerase
MSFTKTQTSLSGVYTIEPQVFGDERGFFMETYSLQAFADI